MTSRNGVPSSTSATPAAHGVAAHRADDGARRRVGAELTEPVGAEAHDGGQVGERLDVAGQRRRRDRVRTRARHLDVRGGTAAGVDVVGLLEQLVDTLPVRRRDARERRTAVDHLEQRRLLAEEVLLGAGDHRDRHRRRPAFGVDLGDGGLEAAHHSGERGLGRDDHGVGADRVGGDERTLDHPVRVAQQDLAVLEAAGFTLGGVDHDRRPHHRRRVRDDGLPLPGGGEAGTATTAESGGGNEVDDGAAVDGAGVGQALTGTGGFRAREVGDGGRGEHPRRISMFHGRLLTRFFDPDVTRAPPDRRVQAPSVRRARKCAT